MRKGGPTSSTRLRSARSRLSLFREFGPGRCKQRPRIERPLGLAAAVVGLRAVGLRELIKAVGIDLVHGRGIPKAAPSSSRLWEQRGEGAGLGQASEYRRQTPFHALARHEAPVG